MPRTQPVRSRLLSSKPHVIIFDFDGTIANSFNAVVEIFYELTKRPRIEDEAEIARLRRLPAIKIAKEMHVSPFQASRLIMKGRKMMAKHLDEVPLFDGIGHALRELHAKGHPLYIMSSNSTQNVEYFLASHNLRKYFVKVQGGVGLLDKAGALKKVMRQNKLNPEECAYVGDEARDIDAAKKAGVYMISVGWGYNDPSLLARQHPDSLIAQPQELITVLEQ